jgi:hypothetical protein
MTEAIHFYDDLIDKDKDLSDEDIHAAMWKIFISLPANRFYTDNISVFQPIMVNSLINWKCANSLEADGDDYSLSIAYILRSSYVDLVTMTALLVGGREWADQVALQVRKQVHGETYQGYKENLEKEKI